MDEIEQDQFAIVELMGHRRFGARITEVDRFGIKMMRAEIQTDPPIIQFVHPQSVYALTVCTVEQARHANNRFALEQAVPMMIPGIALFSVDDDDSGCGAPGCITGCDACSADE